ncbi:ABC transporter substrate-binding protein [Proteocatella sphenisci]|uniref:ABC transporter substrate-binding protein n=1 Tax=Proteocatella sphenisci TaxID=181070 RepID=UPI00048D1C58|nr:MqnA/MqnD/SBP family protein [Proteocatella sphenisci]
MKKSISLMLTVLLSVAMLSGCAQKPEETAPEVSETPINVAVMKGPTGMGMVSLMNQSEESTSLNPYNFKISGTADEIVANIVKGELDIAAVPANLASVLYNKTEGKISVAAINTLGVLYIVENGDTIHSLEDLRGKTIYSTGKGTTPEYALKYLLTSNAIDPQKDLTIEYKAESAEVAAVLASSEGAIGVLPEPFVTVAKSKNENLRDAISFGDEWKKINAQELVTGVIIVRNEFLKDNEGAFKTFLNEYKSSTEFTATDLEKAAELVGKYEIVPAPIAKLAIPKSNIVFIDGESMKSNLGAYLQILFDQDPKSVGGKLPGEDFYYMNQE